MIITCISIMPQTVPYRDGNGVLQLCPLRPGRANYPMLKPDNDPQLSEALRVLRKHHMVAFDDMLPTDRKEPEKKPAAKAAAKKREDSNASAGTGNQSKDRQATKAPKNVPGDKEPGSVPGQGADSGR